MEDYKYTFNYVEIPVLLKGKFGIVYAVAGPSVGVGIIGQYKGTYSENDAKTDDSDWVYFGGDASDYDEDEEWVDNRLDVGIQVGAGVQAGIIVVEFRYGYGLTNLYDKRPGFSDAKSQHRSAQVTVGVALGGSDND